MPIQNISPASSQGDSPDFAPLWQPVRIGSVEIKNRVMISPLNMLWSTENVLSERNLNYYEERARGGVGLIVTEQHIADRDRISTFRQASSALDPRSVGVFADLAERVHAQGTAQFVQLYAPGVDDNVGLDPEHWAPVQSCSYIAGVGSGEVPVVMGQREIDTLVNNFIRAARNVAAGGLDGIELHAAHAWLLHRFLSPAYNLRTDAYGRTAEGRCKLLIDIAEGIKAANGSDFVVGIQVSIDDYYGEAGLTLDVTEEQLGILTASGAFDYVNLSTGNEDSDHYTMPTMELGQVPTAAFGARAKAVVREGVVVALNGGIRDLAAGARLIAAGAADLVSLTRPHLADAFLVEKAQTGRFDETVPEIGDNDIYGREMAGLPALSAINPVAGREHIWGSQVQPKPVETPLALTIIGGGPAGLEAAHTAAARGHRVTVVERAPEVGGRMRVEAALPHRNGWQPAIDSLRIRCERNGVTIVTGVEVTEDSEYIDGADVVVVATGATWQKTGQSRFRVVPLETDGVDHEHVWELGSALEAVLRDPKALGDDVLIVDETGQYLALGLADIVSESGARVRIVSPNDAVAHKVIGNYDHVQIFARLASRDVHFDSHLTIDRIEPDRVVFAEGWSGREFSFEAGTVVLSMLRQPYAPLYERLQARGIDVRLIGDALAPRDLGAVIAEGHELGWNL